MLSYLFGHKFPSLKEQKVPKVEYDRVVAELQTAVNQMNDAIQIGMGHSSASAAFLWCQNHFKWAGGKATPERWNDHFVAFLSGYRETGLMKGTICW